jgi:hypothetical protein
MRWRRDSETDGMADLGAPDGGLKLVAYPAFETTA